MILSSQLCFVSWPIRIQGRSYFQGIGWVTLETTYLDFQLYVMHRLSSCPNKMRLALIAASKRGFYASIMRLAMCEIFIPPPDQADHANKLSTRPTGALSSSRTAPGLVASREPSCSSSFLLEELSRHGHTTLVEATSRVQSRR